MGSRVGPLRRWLLAGAAAAALAAVPLHQASPGAEEAQERVERPSDAELRTRLVERLAASRTLEGSDVWVSVEDRRVTLRGVVQDATTEARAIEIARRTPGVRSVKSELSHDPALAERRRIEVRDEQLAEQIARALVRRSSPRRAPRRIGSTAGRSRASAGAWTSTWTWAT